MRELKKFIKENVFRLLVFASICVIFYYTVGSKMFFRQSNTTLQSNHCSEINSGQSQKNQENLKSETVWNGKPLPVSTLVVEEKKSITSINNVRLADLKNGEQTIIMEDNSQQQGADVILAARGVRAKWVFRFKDGKACNGKISIERFGIIIPVVEKEMEMTFAPLKDFSVTCDKGKFNYYIKVVDNMNTAMNSSTEAKSTSKPSASSAPKPLTQSSSGSSASTKPNTTNSNTQVKPKESGSKSTPATTTPASTPVPSLSSSSNSGQEPAASNENAGKSQEESKKSGILDHLFHHH